MCKAAANAWHPHAACSGKVHSGVQMSRSGHCTVSDRSRRRLLGGIMREDAGGSVHVARHGLHDSLGSSSAECRIFGCREEYPENRMVSVCTSCGWSATVSAEVVPLFGEQREATPREITNEGLQFAGHLCGTFKVARPGRHSSDHPWETVTNTRDSVPYMNLAFDDRRCL